MRQWIRNRNDPTFVLVVLAVLAILTVGILLVVPGLTGGRLDPTPVAESPGTAVSAPTHTSPPHPTPTPTPTSATTTAPDAAEEPQPPAPGKPPPPKPAPPKPAIQDPAIITMNPGPSTGCGEQPSGQTIYLTFMWGARDGNTVDIYYALTDTDVRASSGFTLLGSRLATTGSIQIPRTCPNGAGHRPYVTVKLVAKNAAGSATAYYWGL